jgi:hypothetical protein
MPVFIELYRWKGSPLEPIANRAIWWGSFGRPAKGRITESPNLSENLRLSNGLFWAIAGLFKGLRGKSPVSPGRGVVFLARLVAGFMFGRIEQLPGHGPTDAKSGREFSFV